MNSALLLAAGSGTRMQGAVDDKVLTTILGQSVINYSIKAFIASGCVSSFCIVYRDEAQKQQLENTIPNNLAQDFEIRWTLGGEERQDSVMHGLETISDTNELVFIHDCARPLITPEVIQKIAQAASADRAACLARPVTDTIKRIDQPGEIKQTTLEDLERNRLWAMETPQAFHHPSILKAYRHVKRSSLSITDDTAAAATIGLKTTLVPNHTPNPKITTASDLDYIEWLLQR